LAGQVADYAHIEASLLSQMIPKLQSSEAGPAEIISKRATGRPRTRPRQRRAPKEAWPGAAREIPR